VATSNFFYLAQLVSLTEEFITSVILPLESCSHRAALIYLRESDGRKSGFPNLIVSPVCCSHSLIHLILCCKLHHSLYQLIRIQVPLQSLLVQENVHTV